MTKDANVSGGFNTDVRAGGKVFHVQTENRAKALTIDTAVYVKGRLVHRHSLNYATPENVAALEGEELLWRVEEQHRQIMEDIRDGALVFNVPGEGVSGASVNPAAAGVTGGYAAGGVAAVGGAEEGKKTAGGLQLHLLNTTSWISGSNADLQIEVRAADGETPLSGAELEAMFESAELGGKLAPHRATTDGRGRARIRIALPDAGNSGAVLLIKAEYGSALCEMRFALREKGKKSQSSAAK